MLTDVEKDEIHACMDAMRERVGGFRSRRAQMEMIATVANTLSRCRAEDEQAGSGDHLAIIEAGTGTGKTFGALIPALIMARSRGKRLVVSSSTIALQHQYADKDVPTLKAALPVDFEFAVAKGRKRYCCTLKLMAEATEAGQEDLDLEGGDAETAPDSAGVRKRQVLVKLAEDFDAGRWSGDRDELPVPVPDEIWEGMVTDRQACSGNKCREFARCPFYLAKQRVKDADLVIANHDLVLSALEMEAGSVLPAVDQTIFVFDEAHGLAAKVVEHFSERHDLRGAIGWVADAVEATRDCVLALRLDQKLLVDVRESADALGQAMESLLARIHATRAFDDKRFRRFKEGRIPEWATELGGDIQAAAGAMQKTFVGLREAMLERASAEGNLATRLLSVLGFYAGKLSEVLALWDLMLADDCTQPAPIGRWIERVDVAGRGRDYLLCAAPVSGSEKLRRLLWQRASGAILMSATLTSCGTFDLFVRQSGLASYTAAAFLQVESPFDYRSRARLVIAGMRTDPTAVDAHTAEVVHVLPDRIQTPGTLVLFASAKQMRAVYARLPEGLRRETMVQGLMPKMEMLARHRSAIDRGERSVIFGLQSLAEGVDLPGDYCTHVVIVKLPFSVPDSPLEEARREWIEGQGRSYFAEVTLPETSVRLKQQLGRLLRTISDWGTVTVLDRRLVTKRWGAQLMRGMPDFEVVVEKVGASSGRMADLNNRELAGA